MITHIYLSNLCILIYMQIIRFETESHYAVLISMATLIHFTHTHTSRHFCSLPVSYCVYPFIFISLCIEFICLYTYQVETI